MTGTGRRATRGDERGWSTPEPRSRRPLNTSLRPSIPDRALRRTPRTAGRQPSAPSPERPGRSPCTDPRCVAQPGDSGAGHSACARRADTPRLSTWCGRRTGVLPRWQCWGPSSTCGTAVTAKRTLLGPGGLLPADGASRRPAVPGLRTHSRSTRPALSALPPVELTGHPGAAGKCRVGG